jgi:predicted acetyltransferase
MTESDMLFLARPSVVFQESFLAALKEFQAEGRDLHWDYRETANHFGHFVQELLNRRDYPRQGKVRESIFWLINDQTFVGRLSLRHSLNGSLLQYGGHIGYEIRPSCRRQGFGKAILRLGLEEACEIGLRRVLVTCDDTNIASAKIIEANGGVLENTVLIYGHSIPTRRYWIDMV